MKDDDYKGFFKELNLLEKCPNCLKKHPPDDYTWTRYPYPVYWLLPNDGDGFICRDCNVKKSHKKVILTQIPCGERQVICRECVDESWLSAAKNFGLYKD